VLEVPTDVVSIVIAVEGVVVEVLVAVGKFPDDGGGGMATAERWWLA
jgi:hypothetical protein